MGPHRYSGCQEFLEKFFEVKPLEMSKHACDLCGMCIDGSENEGGIKLMLSKAPSAMELELPAPE
jgi:hypothetical protein